MALTDHCRTYSCKPYICEWFYNQSIFFSKLAIQITAFLLNLIYSILLHFPIVLVHLWNVLCFSNLRPIYIFVNDILWLVDHLLLSISIWFPGITYYGVHLSLTLPDAVQYSIWCIFHVLYSMKTWHLTAYISLINILLNKRTPLFHKHWCFASLNYHFWLNKSYWKIGTIIALKK